MSQIITGIKIRQRRLKLGIRQTDLARKVGISASYLNLIERNKRRIAGGRLIAIASALGLSVEDLTGENQTTLRTELLEIAANPEFAARELDPNTASEFLGRFPGWVRVLLNLHKTLIQTQHRNNLLSDRLTHDPFLAETLHNMLTEITALHSTADILAQVKDLQPGQRRKFERNIADQANRLSNTGTALAQYFDTALNPPQDTEQAETLTAFIERAASFLAAIEEKGAKGTAIEPPLPSAPSAAVRAKKFLDLYKKDADALPYTAFSKQAKILKYDIEMLATKFNQPSDLIMRRLAHFSQKTLPRFALITRDGTGQVLWRQDPHNLLPRSEVYRCPLWALHLAGEALMVQHVQFSEEPPLLFLAQTHPTGPAGYDTLRPHITTMLILRADEATQTVYAPACHLPPVPIGTDCRICTHNSCTHRREDPIIMGI